MNKSKKGKVAILFESRNNYQLFHEIFLKYTTADLSNHYIFNIDLNSTIEQKQLGERVMMMNNIIDIQVDPDDPHLYSANRCLEICSDYIDTNGLDIDWILWFQHDCHFIGDDFLERLEKILHENPRYLSEVGTIGFCDYNTTKVGSPIYGRGDLIQGINVMPHRGWYENLPPSYTKVDHFVVECPQDNGVLFNRHLYKKCIKPDYNFKLFLWVGDVSAQFGLQGIASITLPSLEMADLYRLKPDYGVPRSLSGNPKFFADSYNEKPWIKFWRDKYLWNQGCSSFRREQFEKAMEMYKGTIQEQIFNWHIMDGPKLLDDLERNT